MTSTNFNIGMFENRASSRVLKPPGGGHSQIFGFSEQNAPKKSAQRSEITACFTHDEHAQIQTIETKKTETIMTENNSNITTETTTTIMQSENIDNIDNGNENGSGDGLVVEEEEKKTEEKMGTPSRKRVPPGGFSSGGFW